MSRHARRGGSPRHVRWLAAFAVTLAAQLLPGARPARGEDSRNRPPLTAAALAGPLAGGPSTTYSLGAGLRLAAELPTGRALRPDASLFSVVYPARGARLSAASLTMGARYGRARYIRVGLGVGLVRDQLRLRLEDRRVNECVTTAGAQIAIGVGWVFLGRLDINLSYKHLVLFDGSAPWLGLPLASVGYRL